jgi:membrane protein
VESAQHSRPAERDLSADPDSPAELQGTTAWGALKRAVREFGEDKVTTWAAALTYYAVLSIFPALLVLVSLLDLLGPATIDGLVAEVQSVAPTSAGEILTNALEGLRSNPSASGVLLVIGLAGALWSAAGYVGAFIQAANSIWDVEEGRPIWKTIPLQLFLTTCILLMLAAGAVIIVFTGTLAGSLGELLGLGQTGVDIWETAKWPVLVLIVSFIISLLYWASPNVRQPSFPWVTPGGLIAVVLWIVASLLFGVYLANFASYDATYGSLGGLISFLVWLWISNIVILLGAEVNSELERGRAIEQGHPPEKEPFLPPRDAPDEPGASSDP